MYLLLPCYQTLQFVSFMLVVENFCASEPCEHGGKCTNGGNTFQCECVRFEGRNYGGSTCADGE